MGTKRVISIGTPLITVKINKDEQYIEIVIDSYTDPIIYPYNDLDDIVNVVQQYTNLHSNDMQKLLDVTSDVVHY